MQAIAIPRFDPGAEGIYLVWTWPDLLPLSESGYDIQRREGSDRRTELCETIDQPIIAALDARGEYAAPLGPLRLRRGVPFRLLPLVGTVLRVSTPPAVAGDYPATPLDVGGSTLPAGQAGALVLVHSATGTASQGCDANYTNAAQVKGNLALIVSGTCDLQTKLRNAQQNGAIGAVVFDSGAAAATKLNVAAPGPAIHIPAVSITSDVGAKLAAQSGVEATLVTFGAVDGPGGPLDAFIQELTAPSDVATVGVGQARGRVVVVALYQGKAVAVQEQDGNPQLELRAPAIDTIVVYGAGITTLQICVGELPDAATSDAEWSAAPYIVKGLTLPIKELDPTLAAQGAEFAAAKSRLVAGEALLQQDFTKLAATLRNPAAAAFGRSGERVVLVRTQIGQAYEELAFEGQLAALSLDPKLRRVLGFGFADRLGLTSGHTYVYRITGRFHAEDLYDDIYDVHLVAASTPLPGAFNIRGLGVRFQQPAKVVLDPAPPPDGLLAASRRGIRIDPSGFDSSCLTPSFGTWSAAFDLPRPVTDLVLEVAPGHSFAYSAGDMAAFPAAAGTPLPAGARVPLHFAAPITQLRLAGTGTLFALRLPAGNTGIVELHAETAPILYAAQPLPAPPSTLSVDNLQQPPALLTGVIDDSIKPPPRNPIGFELAWLPATTDPSVVAWPDDLDAGPPLTAVAYQIEHRRTDSPGPWEPLQGGDNLVLGSRNTAEPAVRLQVGVDLDEVYPRVRSRPPGTGFLLHLSDVFGLVDPATGTLRPAQPLGTLHQYQIRAVDAVGRVSASWTLSNIARLEKHVPPPLPAGQQPPPPIDANNHLTAPPGPRARALVAGAPGLTAADQLILGAHANAVVLTWGWRQQERDLDPTTAEFRTYVSTPLDVVSGTITAVASAPPNWQLSLTCDAGVRPLATDECAGQWITTGGYPFHILHHDAGSAPHLVVEPALARPAATPVLGPIVFGRPLQPAHQRPAGWGKRFAVVPLTANDSYSQVFYDLLSLSPAHPRDALWVGVAAADHESYVPDELAAGPNAPRPGNESSIAACAVAARYQGQPVFSRPAPVGNVPELVTEEPTGRQVLVPLDLVALLGGALPPGSPIALERCSSDDVLSRTSVDGAGRVVLADSDGTPQVIAFPNPADQAAVVAALQSSDPRQLANRYQIYLLAHAAHPESFFARVSGQTQPVAAIADRLPPKGRYFYRVRAADALGHVSEGSAILPVAVRVPSTAPAATPLRRSLAASATGVALTVEVPADPDTTQVLLFAAVTPAGTAPVSQAAAELLRLPNRRDLYPSGGLRLQLTDGSLLAPAAVRALAGPGVTTDSDGGRTLTVDAPAGHLSWVTLWCYGLTRDGFPSSACGPFSTGVS